MNPDFEIKSHYHKVTGERVTESRLNITWASQLLPNLMSTGDLQLIHTGMLEMLR